MDKKLYTSFLTALATAAVVWLLTLLATPIIKPIAWAVIIGIATDSYHKRLTNRFPGNTSRTAGLMVLLITVCFILPIASILILIIQNAADWYAEAERLVMEISSNGANPISHPKLINEINALGTRFGLDFSGFITKILTNASGYLLELTTNTAMNLWGLMFTLAVALFILFFIYRDGERIVNAAIIRFSSNQDKARYYASEIRNTTIAVTVGTIFTCIIQGITAAVGYYFAGVPVPVLFGALTALAALIPVVGTGFIWVPIALLVAIYGAWLKALLLALWCLFFVGLADNAIRPLVIGVKNDIPVPAIVLGALCGVFTMGILGLILGPVIFALLVTVWRNETSTSQMLESARNDVDVVS